MCCSLTIWQASWQEAHWRWGYTGTMHPIPNWRIKPLILLIWVTLKSSKSLLFWLRNLCEKHPLNSEIEKTGVCLLRNGSCTVENPFKWNLAESPHTRTMEWTEASFSIRLLSLRHVTNYVSVILGSVSIGFPLPNWPPYRVQRRPLYCIIKLRTIFHEYHIRIICSV